MLTTMTVTERADSENLTCEASGSPAPMIQWLGNFEDELKVGGRGGRVVILSSTRPESDFFTTSQLSLKAVE